MKHSQLVMLLVLLAWGWSAMTLTHELGHVIAAWAQGARVTRLELLPWRLPYSLFSGEHSELVTVWAGPLIGCLTPLAVAALLRHPWAWLIAFFCLVANGCYLLLGWASGDAFLDSTQLIRAGTPDWLLLTVAGFMTVIGYVGLRQSCMALLGGPAFGKRPILIMLVAWAVWFVAQTILAYLVQ